MTDRQTDIRILSFIKKQYKETFEYPAWTNIGVEHRTTKLEELYRLKGLEPREIWDALSRLVVAKKIKAVGSNRNKSYAPVQNVKLRITQHDRTQTSRPSNMAELWKPKGQRT